MTFALELVGDGKCSSHAPFFQEGDFASVLRHSSAISPKVLATVSIPLTIAASVDKRVDVSWSDSVIDVFV